MNRSGKLAVLREPKIISLVFDVFICMSLLVVQDSISGLRVCRSTNYRAARKRKPSLVSQQLVLNMSIKPVFMAALWNRAGHHIFAL